MTIREAQDEIIADFELFGDWMDKYEYIIQLGKELPQIEEQYKTDDNLIRGCQSKVWLHAEYRDGTLIFTADSDAAITKGLVSMVVRVLSGAHSGGDCGGRRYTLSMRSGFAIISRPPGRMGCCRC